MTEKHEHFRVIRNCLAEIRHRLALIWDGTATDKQREAHLAADGALTQFQNFQIKALRRAFLGRD